MPFKVRRVYQGEYENEAFELECTECCEYFNKEDAPFERCPFCGSHHVVDSDGKLWPTG